MLVMRNSPRVGAVRVPGEKLGTCSICGTLAKRVRTFEASTVADGVVRDRAEVFADLCRARDAWQKEPVTHARCEATAINS